jgi:hypothetical protein
MSTSHKSHTKKSSNSIDQLIFEKGIRIADVIIRKKPDIIIVLLNTGHILKLQLSDFPHLKKSSEKSLNEWRLIGGGIGIHWKEIDEDLSLKGFIASSSEKSSILRKLRSDRGIAFA